VKATRSEEATDNLGVHNGFVRGIAFLICSLPSLMDIFAGSDEVVRFEAVGPEDEAAAQQETDYVNHVFMQQNAGFMSCIPLSRTRYCRRSAM
jgi:hypothetical protein